MTTIYMDSDGDDAMRRVRLYQGDILVYSPRPSTIALCDFAKAMIGEAFGGLDPTRAQYHMQVERFVEVFAPLKPRFIHHPRTKELIKEILSALGCDLHETYLDVPRLRGVTSDGYLTSGVGYAHHPHRDTWYAAPMCQLNWWLPIYDFESESSMAFHPRYWCERVANDSSNFNYFEWNADGRKNAAKSIQSDTRKQPRPMHPVDIEPQIRVVCKAGGIIVFSGAQLHSTVPNTSGQTRFSIDFRTIHIGDVLAQTGAPNIDSDSPTTALRDFMRWPDLERVPDEVIRLYEKQAIMGGEHIFRAEIGTEAR